MSIADEFDVGALMLDILADHPRAEELNRLDAEIRALPVMGPYPFNQRKEVNMDETQTKELNRLEEFDLALRHWVSTFEELGMEHLVNPLRGIREDIQEDITRLRDRVSEAV